MIDFRSASCRKFFIFLALLGISILLHSYFTPTPANAQSCSFSYQYDCDITPFGCTPLSDYDTVSCSFGGTCPSGYTGTPCNYSSYPYSYRYCRYLGSAGNYDCVEDEGTFGPGYCGCNPDPGGGDDGGGDTGGGDTGGGTGGCSCTPSCTNPSGLSFSSPGANSTIQPGTILRWSINSWGLDSNSSACNNNSCSYQSYSGHGRYQLFVGSTNITQYCQGHLGSGSGAYLTANQCTLTTPPTSWPGTTQTIIVRATSNCGSTETSRAFSWAPNEKPFCTNIAVSSVQGRWAGSLYGVRENEAVSFTVTGGETDPYGPPRIAQLCYAIRNQTAAFYQTAGGVAWRCIGQSTNSNSYNVSTTFAQMKADYAPAVAYSGTVDQHGFVIVANIGDNMSNNTCTTNIGWNNGAGAYRPNYPPETCNGGTCVLNLHNNAPNIGGMTVGTPSGTWIGTPEDTDNGLSCTDNNPFSYYAYVSDPDGSADIDRIDFSVATPTQVADANNDNLLDDPLAERNIPLRVIFAKRWEADGNQEFANGTFFIRDTQAISNNSTTRRCYDQNRGLHLIDPTGWDTSNPSISRNARSTTPYSVWCFGYDGHSWDDVAPLLNQNLNGIAVDVYYLRSDLTVYSEGYTARLKGDNSSWQNASYVAYERGTGTRAFVHFKVEYLKDGTTDRWSGQYKNAWSVIDILGRDDDTENFPGEYMATNQFGNSLHVFGDTNLDLTAPTVTVNSPNPISATRLQVAWFGTDSRSGLNHVYGEANATQNPAVTPIYYQPGNISYDLTQHPPATTPPPTASPFLWSKAISGSSSSFAETIDVGGNEQGSLHFDTYIQDNACNLGQSTTQISLALPWIMTRGGLLYTEGAPDIDVKSLPTSGYPNSDPLSPEFTTYPFNINRWEVGLSSELVATNETLLSTAFEDVNLVGDFSLQSYSDANNRDWYQSLRNQISTQMTKSPEKFNYITGLSGLLAAGRTSALNNAGADCSDPEKLCVVDATALSIVNLSSPFICDRKTAFLISEDLTINADISSDTAINGCIFIVQGNVTIGSSSYKSGSSGWPRYDLIEAFIISDGTINVLEDTDGSAAGFRDGLKIRGGLLGFGEGVPPYDRSLVFERSLKLLNNLVYPSVVIHHDPRYYNLAEEILGGDNESYKVEVGFKPEQ